MRRWVLPVVSAGIAVVVLAPLLGRGFVLSYDMVFAPRQAVGPDALGLGSALPRSVPSDAVVGLLTYLVPGDIVQKVVLALALFAAALGAGRLVPTESVATRVVAAVAYGWSAYVAERLLIGHWQLLVAYAGLPWIVAAGLGMRRGEEKATLKLILACAPAVITPSGGIIAGVAAIVAAGVRRAPLTAAGMVVLNAPWWVPAVLRAGDALSTSDGVGAFAARAEAWGSPVLSVLGLGGIWNSEVTPTSRGNPLVPALILAMVAVALLGLPVLARRWGGPAARALVLLGAAGVLLAVVGSLPVGAGAVRWLVEHVPGAGMLRDGQRWVAWWALPLAIGFALAVERATGYLRTTAARRALLGAAAIFPVAIMPDLAWGAAGRLASVEYPGDWADVRAILSRDERPGDVVSLPLSAFRRFEWNADRTQLDPAPRALPRPVVIDDTLIVGGRPIAGEDPRAAAVRNALRAHEDLGRLGVGWVLVEHGTPGPVPEIAGLQPVYQGTWLSLYRLPGPVEPVRVPGARWAVVLAADLAALALLAICLLWRVLPAGKLIPVNRRARE